MLAGVVPFVFLSYYAELNGLVRLLNDQADISNKQLVFSAGSFDPTYGELLWQTVIK